MNEEMETTNDEQTIDDMVKRAEALVPLRDVIAVVKKHFSDMHDNLPKRSPLEQGIIGGFITSLELELKKDLKDLQGDK